MLQILEEREEVIEILRSVRRLCEKVVRRLQKLLSELTKLGLIDYLWTKLCVGA